MLVGDKTFIANVRQKHEIELRLNEAEMKRCDVRGCQNRIPPIAINSGFRSKDLNRAVGGASTSQHLKGEAADICAGTKEDNRKLFEIIRKELPFDQLINENNYSWVHVSYREGANRKQLLKMCL